MKPNFDAQANISHDPLQASASPLVTPCTISDISGDIFLLLSLAVSFSAWLPKGYELFSFLAIRFHKQKHFVLHTRKPSGIGQASPTCHGYAVFSCLIAFPPFKNKQKLSGGEKEICFQTKPISPNLCHLQSPTAPG